LARRLTVNMSASVSESTTIGWQSSAGTRLTAFWGSALLPMKGPIAWAVEEAQRTAKMRLRSFGIPTEVLGHSYRECQFDPLWACLEEIGLAVSLHVGTDEPFHTKFIRLALGKTFVDTKIGTAQRALADLIWGAVPQRYPKLRFVLAEGGIGWVASVLRSMDHWWEDHRRWMMPKIDESATYYFRRQFWATFEDDPAGIRTRDLIGVERLMWGSDYPHTEGTFPRSREQFIKDFQGMPDGEIYQMVAGNAWYGSDSWFRRLSN
jgi:predicted TIM-barrel fold metal-dependent hydrolase